MNNDNWNDNQNDQGLSGQDGGGMTDVMLQ